MLVHNDGLFVALNRLGLDVSRPVDVAYISHAHFDHMAKHQLALCTPETAELYRHRLGPRRTFILPFERPMTYSGVQLTTYPAGHMLGSSMLLLEAGETRLLYTGDFQLRTSRTCRQAIVPQTDVLVMECTFGSPEYVFPARELAAKRLVKTVSNVFSRGNVPVIEAYVAGKAQEIVRILSDAEIACCLHPEIFAICQVYEQLGRQLGRFACYDRHPIPGTVVIVPPASQRSSTIGPIHRQERIAVTGWAIRHGEARRRKVDHAIPFSDHADYAELLEIVVRSEAKKILCLHGPSEFATDLRNRGYDAQHLVTDRHYLPLG